ncbi:Protein of unknown function [Pyronema omphalodes CBS 100304]|uniref:Uncharacterized protein n=1 Tax=Pyronema omphalodes (strain CBS 100304) TaxID=1076935 RepID=U4L6T8_PYROM|nr:Protein of unknown function [Pyronema omphalodes CBS 100304]
MQLQPETQFPRFIFLWKGKKSAKQQLLVLPTASNSIKTGSTSSNKPQSMIFIFSQPSYVLTGDSPKSFIMIFL